MKNLSKNEIAVLIDIRDFGFGYLDNGLEVGSGTWSSELTSEIADALGINKKSAGAVMGSLLKKELIGKITDPMDSWLYITKLGLAQIMSIK